MIIKEEMQEIDRKAKVRLVQPTIASYFNSRKNESNVLQLANKQIAVSSGKSRKWKIPNQPAAALKKRQVRKPRLQSLSQTSNYSPRDNANNTTNKWFQSVDCTISKYLKVEETEETHCTMSERQVQAQDSSSLQSTFVNILKVENTNDIRHLIEGDNSLTIENCMLTIRVDDSDEGEDKSNENPSSEIKRSCFASGNLGVSPSKRIKHGDEDSSSSCESHQTNQQNKSKVRKSLFNEERAQDHGERGSITILTPKTINEKSCEDTIFEDDTVDLAHYGLPVDELEAYSPSQNQTLDISKPSTSHDAVRFHESAQFETTDKKSNNITKETFYDNACATTIKEEVNDSDDTLPWESAQLPHLLSSTMSDMSNLECMSATVTTQTVDDYSQVFNRQFDNTAPLAPVKTEVEGRDLEQLPVDSALFKAWKHVGCSPPLAALLGDERRSLEILFALQAEYQNICLRLYTRQAKWQRRDKFISDIRLRLSRGDLYEAISQLEMLEFIHTDFASSESLETILNYLLVPELRRFLTQRRIKMAKPIKKLEMVAELKHFAAVQPSVGPKSTDQRMRADAAKVIGECLRLDDHMREALFRLQLLHHFAVPDITSHYEYYTYMADIAAERVVLPEYQVHDLPAFESAEAFNRYATSMELLFSYSYQKERMMKKRATALMDIAKKAFATLEALHNHPEDTSPIHQRFTAEHVYAKILTMAVVDLTKHADDVQSWLQWLLESYRGAKRGEWYDRLAMHLEKHAKQFDRAADVINRGLADTNATDIDKYVLTARAKSLIKRKKIAADLISPLLDVPALDYIETVVKSQSKVGTFQNRRLVYKEDAELFTVEEIALRHYARNGYPNGVHCENALLMTLFTALFWDIIYMDVPGEHPFVSRLQYIPLDLYSREFYLRRKREIDQRLTDIAEDWAEDDFFHRLRLFHVEHSHRKSVHDARLSGAMMIEAAACIGRPKLAKMLTRLVKDVRQYRSGMPDLFVWNNESKKCMFIEVKSIHDQLSVKQKRWLEFLRHIEVPVDVCRVYSKDEKIPKLRTKQL